VGGNNATLVNGVTFTNGEVGLAFSFDGVGSYLLVNATPNLDVGTGSGMTFEGWIYPATLDHEELIYEFENNLGTFNGADTGCNCSLHPEMPGALCINLLGTDETPHIMWSPLNSIVTNVWQHIAVTYDNASGAATLYIKGAAVTATNFGSFTPQTSFPHVVIGARTTFNSVSNPGDAFLGMMDELSFYSRALSADEIAAIYAAGSAGKCSPSLPPGIAVQPASQSVADGGNVEFSVLPSGTGPFSCQWTFNGKKLSGATNVTLSLTNVHPAQAGNYAVKITSPYGATNSANATLTVITQTILIYKYSGSEAIVTTGQEQTFPYSGLMYFLPATTNGIYVGWATIQGRKTYWVNTISQSILITIPGNAGQSYTVFGDAGSGYDDNGQANLHCNLLKGWNTTLNIGAKQSFVFPSSFAGENTHAYPDSQTGQMKLDAATSSFTFAALATQTANNAGQTVQDLVNAQVKTLTSQGYHLQ
jgi:hypothetical protein